jgi:hypothetical protein
MSDDNKTSRFVPEGVQIVSLPFISSANPTPELVEESPLSGMALAVEAIHEMIVDEIAKSEDRIVKRVLEELPRQMRLRGEAR